MLAILGILLEEYDADSRPPASEYKLPGEYSDMEIRRVSTYSGVCSATFLIQFARLTRGPGYGAHCYEVVAASVSARTARRATDVQVRNNVRCVIEGGEGFGCPAERFNFRDNLELKLKAKMHPLCCCIFATMGSVPSLYSKARNTVLS